MKRFKYKRMCLLAALIVTGTIDSFAQINYDYIFKYAGTGVFYPDAVGGISTSRRVLATAMTVDNEGAVYTCEGVFCQIIRIDPVTGITSRIAGTGTTGFSPDGTTATSAQINPGRDMVIDPRNNDLYFIDQYVPGGGGGTLGSGSLVRKISGGVITTVAGNGTIGHSGDGFAAVSASISARSIAIGPNGKLIIAEPFYIREVNGTTINTIAGTGSSPYTSTGDGGAATAANIDIDGGSLRCDRYGNIYFSETQWQIVRKIDIATGVISKFAGTRPGTSGTGGAYTGDGGAAIAAKLNLPLDLAFDAGGNMYINDYSNYVIRKVSPGGDISTIAGNNTSSTAGLPSYCGITPKNVRIGRIARMAISNDNYLYLYNEQNPVIWKLSDGLKIKDVDLNTLCFPGSSTPSVTPKFTVTAKGGVPPYTYNWVAASPLNKAVLSSYSSGTPDVVAFTGLPPIADFILAVGHNSPCGNTDSRRVKTMFNGNQTYDLAIKDSYFDMLDEPNSQLTLNPAATDFVHPADLWNRIQPDDQHFEQDPVYGSGFNNKMYAVVRNVGCLAAPANKQLSFYWTLASTGEAWPGTWTTDLVPGSSLPTGLHINTINMSALNPGDKKQYGTAWTVPNPTTYSAYLGGDPNRLGTCFLARLDPPTIPYPEVSPVMTNVKNNNNIATRNSWVTRVNSSTSRKSIVGVGNALAVSQVYSLRFRNLDPANSTLSQFLNVTVYLGPVYSLWVSGGSVGTYASTDPVAQTVTFDGTSDMLLENITFAANDQFFIEWSFDMLPGVTGTDMRNEELLFEQLITSQGSTEASGAIHTLVIYDGQTAGPYPVPGLSLQDVADINSNIKVFPNPASSQINFELKTASQGTIILMDAMGRKVSEQAIAGEKKISFDVKSYTPGIYFYKVQAGDKMYSGSVLVGK